MFERVRQLLAKNLKVDPDSICMDTDMISDLGVNSLDLVELVCVFEMEFDMEVNERDIRNFRKVSDIVVYLEDRT